MGDRSLLRAAPGQTMKPSRASLSALAAARAAEASAIASCKKRISDTTIDVVAA